MLQRQVTRHLSIGTSWAANQSNINECINNTHKSRPPCSTSTQTVVKPKSATLSDCLLAYNFSKSLFLKKKKSKSYLTQMNEAKK